MVLKEFLVALGLQDNMTAKLNKSMKGADNEVSKFASGFAKKFALAGVAVATFSATAAVGMAKFATSLVKADDELDAFAKKIGQSKAEAYKTKSALDVMGKSMEEIQLDPKLQAQFKELKANAADLKIPDMSEGLNTVRAITTSVLALKQTAMNALSWVGHSFLKYVAKPMEDIQKLLKGFNDTVKKNIPEWSDKIGKALSWVVQLGGTVIRGAATVFKAVSRIFDMIPGKAKLVMGAFALLGAFIKAGPIGKLIMVISAVLLLLDDFFTYLDGGESLLGPVWKVLIDLFDKAKQYIPDIIGGIADLINWLDKVGALKPLIIGVGTAFLAFKAVSTASNLVKGLTTSINTAAKSVDAITKGIKTNSTLFGNFGKAVSGLKSSISDLNAVTIKAGLSWVKSTASLVAHKVAMLAAAVAHKAAAVAQKAVTAAQRLMNAAMSANPIGLIIAAVAALIAIFVALWKNNEGFRNFFINLWNGIKDFFVNLWENIKAIFTSVWDFLKGVIDTASSAFSAAFEAAGNFFKSIWEGVSNFFSGIWDGIVNVVSGAMKKVMAFIQPIIDIINKMKDGIGGVINFVGGLFGGGKKEGGHAEGGVFDKEHYAQFAEGNKPEAVIPLTKPKRAAEVMREAADYMGGTVPSAPQSPSQAQGGGKSGAGDKLVAVIETLTAALQSLVQAISGSASDGGHAEGGGSVDLAAIGERMLTFLANAERVMSQMGQVTQTSAAYNAVSNSHTSFNTTTIDNKQNYTINDTSGSPRTTADMVSRTQALHNRNLKGVFA